MAEAFVFRVHGTPRPQPRGRTPKGRNRPVSIVSPKVRLWREALKRYLAGSLWGPGRFSGPLLVRMVFTFRPPASATARLGRPHTQRPDGDNLAKLVLDVLESTGVIGNDCTVAELVVSKLWGNAPGVAVTVAQIAAPQRRSVDYGSRQPPAWLTRS